MKKVKNILKILQRMIEFIVILIKNKYSLLLTQNIKNLIYNLINMKKNI